MSLVLPFIVVLVAVSYGLAVVIRPMVFLAICQRIAEFGGKDPAAYDDAFVRTVVRLWGLGFAGVGSLIIIGIVSEWI